MTVLSICLFSLLAFGIARPVTWLLVAAVPVALCATKGYLRLRWPSLPRPSLAVAVLAVYTGYYLPHVLTPEITYDASGYHLGLAAEWLRLGGFPQRVGFYELLPQGMECIYGASLAIYENSVSPKVVHFICLVGTVQLLSRLSRRMGLPVWAAPAASVVYFTCPVVGLSAASAYTDVAFVLAILTAFYLTLDHWEYQGRTGWLAAGLASGFCYSIKMPGLLVPVAVCTFLLIRARWKESGWFTLGVAAAVLPWMVRCLWLTGNPVAPLMNSLFPNEYFPPEVDAHVRSVVQFMSGGPSNTWEIIQELSFHGARLGLMAPLVLAMPLGLLALSQKKVRPIAIAGCLLFLIYTQNLNARFLLPSFLFMSLALAASVPRRVAQALVLFAAFCCWPAVTSRYASPAVTLAGWPIRAAFGLESQETYLRRQMPIYRFAEFVRERAPAFARVFDCAGLPSFYSHVVTQQYWQTREMIQLHRALLDAIPADDCRAIGAEFTKHGVRYITIPAGAAAGVPWAASLMKAPEHWGFKLVGAVGDYRLYEVISGGTSLVFAIPQSVLGSELKYE